MNDLADEARRRRGVENAFADLRLDGRSPSPGALQDAADYIYGRRTLDEIIEDVRRRHTRLPLDEQ
ncbi:antitoxin VbhA family protein [Microbacterium sp. LWO13-1.2]|uniref:antitoxin VbhA family protein n=1 Tax=Microbacterium sp. LWO13-1.2 TaxID=3135262 RepID=UPI00313911CC